MAIQPQAFLNVDKRVRVATDLSQAYAEVEHLLSLAAARSMVGPGAATQPAPRLSSRQRTNLKIQDGCNSKCSYCIVHVARGAARSEPLPQIIASAQAAEADGLREIVLTGVNLGSYDWQNTGLSDLLVCLLESTDKCRFRLSSLEPLDANARLIDTIAASSGRICAHLHLPLQSGSDKILRAMNRPYDTARYAELVAYARTQLPRLALSTDVITGFPGESEDDFQQTYEFCRQMQFMRMHVFRFSPRPGTVAAELPDRPSAQTAARRAEALRELALQMQSDDVLRRIGSTEQVLVERKGWARTESYHLVACPKTAEIGSLVPMRFSSYANQLIECE